MEGRGVDRADQEQGRGDLPTYNMKVDADAGAGADVWMFFFSSFFLLPMRSIQKISRRGQP